MHDSIRCSPLKQLVKPLIESRCIQRCDVGCLPMSWDAILHAESCIDDWGDRRRRSFRANSLTEML